MSTPVNWLSDIRDWLDARGKGAWIATMVLGFVFLWPVGLAILFYMIWSNRMGCAHRKNRNTLKRLDEEQSAFQGFMDRLRQAKDKAEFDQFMEDRDSTIKGKGDEVPA